MKSHQQLRSYEIGLQLRASSNRLEESGVELRTPGCNLSDLSTTSWRLLNLNHMSVSDHAQIQKFCQRGSVFDVFFCFVFLVDEGGGRIQVPL